jgi:hypothetical protein
MEAKTFLTAATIVATIVVKGARSRITVREARWMLLIKRNNSMNIKTLS